MRSSKMDDDQPNKPSDAEIARETTEDTRQIALKLLADTPMGMELVLNMGEDKDWDDPTLAWSHVINLLEREAGVVTIESTFTKITLKEKRVIETAVYRLALGPNGEILAFEKTVDGALIADLESEGDPYDDPDHMAITHLNALRKHLFAALQECLDELDRREMERAKAQGAFTYGEDGLDILLGREPPRLNQPLR